MNLLCYFITIFECTAWLFSYFKFAMWPGIYFCNICLPFLLIFFQDHLLFTGYNNHLLHSCYNSIIQLTNSAKFLLKLKIIVTHRLTYFKSFFYNLFADIFSCTKNKLFTHLKANVLQ